MINIKDHKTGHLWDPWGHLGVKRRKLLAVSWADTFRKYILQQLPIASVIPFFSEGLGRPTKELYALLGALLLQQFHDLTDKETVEQFSFNAQWHYALNITGAGDEETYLCLKTLWNARKIVYENKIDKILFEDITDHLIKKSLKSDYPRPEASVLRPIYGYATAISKAFKRQSRPLLTGP